jgi:Glycosyltransferase family 87
MDQRPSGFLMRAVPRAIVIVVAIVAFVPLLSTLGGDDRAALAAGGDFPSFYAAGAIVLDGRIEDLPDAGLQRAYQADFHDDPDEFLYFAYPPIVAIAYAPLAALPYAAAYAVHTLAALTALVGAIWVMWPRERFGEPGRDGLVAATALALVSYPIAVAVLGGQNTTFTLLLVALVWRFASSGRPVAAGVAAAAMLYKPQYGLIVIGLLLVAAMWRAVGSALVGAGVIYVVTTAVLGAAWPMTWWRSASWFGSANDEVNGHLMVNIRGWMTAVFGDGTVATIVAIAAIVVVGLVTAVVVHRMRIAWLVFGAATAGMVLIAPSALAYDAGIPLVAGAVFVVIAGASTASIGVLIAASWLELSAGWLGWSPLFLVVAILWFDQVVAIRHGPGSVSQAPGTIAAPADS